MTTKTKILIGILVIGVVLIGGWWVWSNRPLPKVGQPPKLEKTETARVGLWNDCDPKINNCEIGLKCIHYYGDVYKCIKYLKEGEECGRSVAELCGEGLACVDTNETRTVCGTFSTKGEQECFIEPLQICKSL